MVAALLPLFVDFEDVLAAVVIELVVLDCEAAQNLPMKIKRGVEEVDPVVVLEVWIESHSDEAVLLVVCDDEFAQGRDRFGLGIVALQLSRDFDEVDL